jgi:hypothetical protein
MGLSIPSMPGKWIASSPLKFFRSSAPHRLQLIIASPQDAARGDQKPTPVW